MRGRCQPFRNPQNNFSIPCRARTGPAEETCDGTYNFAIDPDREQMTEGRLKMKSRGGSNEEIVPGEFSWSAATRLPMTKIVWPATEWSQKATVESHERLSDEFALLHDERQIIGQCLRLTVECRRQRQGVGSRRRCAIRALRQAAAACRRTERDEQQGSKG